LTPPAGPASMAPMTPAVTALLAEYNAWMNRRLYDAAALPAGAVERDMGAFFGSLLQTLNHISATGLRA
jgi:uncharacterized damage-inducible protein DinB